MLHRVGFDEASLVKGDLHVHRETLVSGRRRRGRALVAEFRGASSSSARLLLVHVCDMVSILMVQLPLVG